MLKSLVLLASIGSAAAIPGYITHLTWDGKYLARGPRTVKYGVEYFGDGSPVFACVRHQTALGDEGRVGREGGRDAS